MPSLARPLPLAETVAALRAGRIDLEAHVEAALARAQETAPDLRALLPEPGRAARVRAEVATLRARSPDSRAGGPPPLFGALLGVKDIFAVDGLPTRGGSALPAQLFAMPEATSVARLRRAGAIVLGKTVTTEFAYLEAGATANPHDRARTPGGSSSGSAAAVAAGIVPLALGTQTIGSVLRPAAFCGIVGFKPSYGRVPSDGVIPLSRTVDTVGTFTQDVAGAALAAETLLDGWAPAGQAGRPLLGVPAGPYLEQAQPPGRAAFDEAIGRLEAAGYRVTEVDALADIEAVNARHDDLIAAEFAAVHRDWFAEWGALYRGGTAGLYDRGRRVSAPALAAARAGPAQLRDILTRRMTASGIDAWIAPAAPGPAPAGLDATGSPRMNLPWTHAGLPAITLPAGTVDGLPVGVQVVARAGDDERLLAWALELEAALR